MKKNNASAKFAKIMGSYGMILILLLLIICFAVSIPQGRFLSSSNIFNVLRQVSIVGIIAVGMTFIMLTGGIDLSCGSVAGFAGVGAALLMTKYTMNPVLAALLMCVLGAVFGIQLTQSAAAAALASVAAATVGRAVSQVLVGWIPFVGNAINASTAAALTESGGWLLAKEFASQSRAG